MPIQKIILRPGLNTIATETLNEGGYSQSNLIRWRGGLAEKIGGWQRLYANSVLGVARGLHAFSDLNSINYLAIGTNSNLEILSQGILYDITPIASTTNATPDFTTVATSNSVEVHDASYSPNIGDYVNIFVPVSIGGIVVQGLYPVATVIDSSHFTFLAASAATGSVGGGGAVPLFTTTMSSPNVQVTLNNHGLIVGNNFSVQVSTAVGGITFLGNYVVTTVIDSNNFTFNSGTNASSSTNGSENAGNARIYYLISAGPVSDTVLQGWGAGRYGEGPYGIGETSNSAINPARNWFLDNFGENLLAAPTNGPLYQWIPPVDLTNFATVVTEAPSMMAGMFVTMPAAQVVALGAEVSGTQDPLLIRWSDNGDYSSAGSWTATVINQAGSYRLSRGSAIIGGLQAQQFGLIWTDIDLWSMQYIQPPFIYDFTTIAQNCGLLAPKSFVLLGNYAYWTSHSSFFIYGANGVAPLPCPIFDTVFKNLDYTNADKAFMGGNSLFNEWMFFFPSISGATGEIDMYAKYNVLEQLWDYGNLVRTCWIDQTGFDQGYPIGIDGAGLIQQHEVGYDADGVAMTDVFIESGYVDISDGLIYLFVDWIIPDFILTGSDPNVTITVYVTDYPGSTPTAFGPYTITQNMQFPYISIRTRARQMAFKVESDSVGTFWRIGAIRYRAAKSGRVG